MANIFKSLQSLIEPELSKAASALGEPAEKISYAASGILPGLLSKILHKGPSAAVDGAIQSGDGARLTRTLLGDHADDFTAAWSKTSGIGNGNTGKLVTMIATAVAVFLNKSNLNGSGLINELNREKDQILGAIPAEMRDIPLTMPAARGAAHAATAKMAAAAAPVAKKKGGLGWLWWLLGLILLALLLLFGLRSCRDKKVKVEAPVVEMPVVSAPAADMFVLTLPDGVKLDVKRGSLEDRMVAFLNSDTYKNAKDADLRNHWFEFEEVDFVRDSASEFMNAQAADKRLSNVAAIMKAYPTAYIRIGGNADKTGNEAYNMEISRERAVFIDLLLDKKGLEPNRISTEGFGEENAVWPATATAEEAAPDRDIAFRFTKK